MNNIIQTIRHAARAATVLLIALLAAQTAGAQGIIRQVSDASGLLAAFGNTNVSVVNVTNDITGVGDLPPLNRALTINLNGHTISGNGLNFNVGPDCSLTINGGGGNIISGKADVPAIYNRGTVTLSNVNIITYPDHAINGDGTLNIGDNASFKYISDIDNASGLEAALNDTNVGVINVTDNITGVGAPPLDHDLTINLNGHTISGDGLHFNVGTGCSLTINGGGQDGSVGNIISGYANQPAIENNGTVTLSNVNITTNSESAIQGGTLNIGNNVSFNGWTSGPFLTQNVNTEGGNYSSTVVATVTIGGVTHYFENSDIALAYITNNAGKVDFSWSESGDTYTIHTAAGWDFFCSLLANKAQGFFTGKTVRLGADIGTADAPVTRMADASGKEFTGTFDGQGHTLTVNYANTDNNVMTAPFSYVDGATIRNLIVDGTISGSAYRAAGIIGETGNTTSHITNCVSSVTISGDRYTGGFSIGGNVAIEGCVFNGKINATSRSGGFIGHSNSAQVIKNSLFAPKDGSSISGGTFYYNGDGDVAPVNSYYTRTLGTAQGKALHSVTAGDDVTLALSGTATKYTVSGITAYEGNQGIKYGTTYYAGSGDEVSLTLSNTGAPLGYQYGYTASAGTLIGSTLTMPAEDVTVSVNTAVLTAIPWDGDGTEGSPYIIKYASQLDLLAYRVNGTHGETRREDGYENKFFQLAKDISYTHTSDWDAFDSDESNFEAIGGYYDDDDRSFSGHFDGNNKTISGIRIHKDGIGNANMFQGIFGLTGSGADIHDLTLANARITGYDYTGGIVGYNDGATVTHCHVAGDVAVCAVQSYAHYHGGIAGNNDGTIEQCTSAANLTIAGATSAYYGGIAGINYGTLSDNLAIGATVPAAAYNTYGAITGSNGGTLQRNYYANCKVANTENATGVGCGDISDGNGGYIVADVNNDNNPDGAVSINTLALTANLAPDGIYWTTYYNGALGFTIDDDEHACAYTATYGAGQLTLHKLGKEIPAGTAVIIVADNDVVSMTAATDLDDISISGTNDLHGVDYDTPVADIRNDLGDGTFYVLGMTTVGDEQHFGFHRYTGEEMAAHKAFVLVSGSQALARSLTMVFDEASGIESLTPDAAPKPQAAQHWFTLDGRRLQAKPTAPGIYVNNGRKVMIK